jgi:pimeloyl-ACP methyl ester carboxylesterase
MRSPIAAAAFAALAAGAAEAQLQPDVQGARERASLYTVAGQGSPAIVFEAGAGESRLTWAPVFLALSTDATVFAYDRPGSQSNPDVSNPYEPDEDGLTSPEEAVDHLRGLLADAGLAPPYVLVAHSLGGGYVLKFAQLHPDEVAGIVMVDARVPTIDAVCREALPDYPQLCGTSTGSLAAAPAYVRAEIGGQAQWEVEGPAAGDLGDTPITMIAATVTPLPPPEQLARMAEAARAIPNEARVRDADAFRTALRDYAEAADDGRYVEATGAGHYVHRDQPQLVIDEIRTMLARVRTGAWPE